MTWQMQEAKARFGELLDASLSEGPQVVAQDGKEMAVLVPIDERKRLQGVRPTLKDVLLQGSPRIDDMMIPERGHWRHREPPEF
jgi:prevent-host-death family protein